MNASIMRILGVNLSEYVLVKFEKKENRQSLLPTEEHPSRESVPSIFLLSREASAADDPADERKPRPSSTDAGVVLGTAPCRELPVLATLEEGPPPPPPLLVGFSPIVDASPGKVSVLLWQVLGGRKEETRAEGSGRKKKSQRRDRRARRPSFVLETHKEASLACEILLSLIDPRGRSADRLGRKKKRCSLLFQPQSPAKRTEANESEPWRFFSPQSVFFLSLNRASRSRWLATRTD